MEVADGEGQNITLGKAGARHPVQEGLSGQAGCISNWPREQEVREKQRQPASGAEVAASMPLVLEAQGWHRIFQEEDGRC